MPGVFLALAASAVVVIAGVVSGLWPVFLLVPVLLAPIAIRFFRGPSQVPDREDRETYERRRNAMATSRPRPGTTGRPASGEGDPS